MRSFEATMRLVPTLLVLAGIIGDCLVASAEPPPPEAEEHPGSHGWSYSDQMDWVLNYPECVGKHLRQSPIDIVTADTIYKPDMKLEFVNYDQDVDFEYKNTHHSVSLTPIPEHGMPSVILNWVKDDDTPDEYELKEIHFHWGDGIDKGSEHEVNGELAAAEMHMVHYRKGLKASDIGTTENSVVVIGVFIESDVVKHNKLESLVSGAENVNGTDAEYKSTSPESLINLLPNNHQSFYTYNGSLTTPPCYEVVTWVLMSEPVYMLQDQLEMLSNLETIRPGGVVKISSNRRSVQPLLLRPVYASFDASDSIAYNQSRIGNLIGSPDQPMAQALDRFWTDMKKVRGDVQRRVRKTVDRLGHVKVDRRPLKDYLHNIKAGNVMKYVPDRFVARRRP